MGCRKGRSFRIPGSAKSAGVIVSGTKSGKIEWNERFLSEHGELGHFEEPRLENGTIEFSPLGEEVTVTVKDALAAKRLAAGATWTFDCLIADTPLLRALKQTFGRYNVWRKILSLAYFLNIAEGSAATRYESFAETHRLPWPKPMCPGSISGLFQNITNDKIDRFFRTLGELTAASGGGVKYWALDSTSVSTHSGNLSKSAWGHDKDGDSLPQVSALMVVNRSTGEPVYFRDFASNEPDIVAVRHCLQEHCRMRLDSDAVIVADRGYGSVSNADRFFQNNISFLLNLKTSFAVCKTLFKEACQKLLDPLSFRHEIGSHAVTVETERSCPANFATDCEKRTPKLKAKMYVHFFYSRDIFDDERKKLTSNISAAAALLRKSQEIPKPMPDIAEKFLIVKTDENGNIVSISTNRAAVDACLDMKGVRVLASDIVSDATEAFKAFMTATKSNTLSAYSSSVSEHRE